MRKPDHTTVRHRQLWVRLYIPADVRPYFDGQTLFLEKLGPWPMPFHQANAMASGFVAAWKRRIEMARSPPTGITAITEADNGVADDALELMTEAELRSVARGLLAQLKSSPARIGAQVTNPVSALEAAFLAHFEEWQDKTHLKGKTLDQAVSDIKQFAASVSESLGSLSGRDVQAWIEDLLNDVGATTVRRKVSALKSYWGWMQAHEHVSQDRDPFGGRQIRDRRTRVEQALDKRQRFEPEEVTRLIRASADDEPLSALIRLAAFTGGRREGLASLKTDSVVQVEGIPSLRLQEKSEAGVRDVPIHPQIARLVTMLVKDSKAGFLIPSQTNRYGQRGDSLGKRFTRLKTSLGFDENHTFHSIRHTVVHLFRKAECPLEIRNQILGHEDGDSGAGAGYGGHIDQKHKLQWITRAITYPPAREPGKAP
jgi:integrase